MDYHETSRRNLYELVWQKPMRLLAPELGISNVGLTKVCRKHDIPVPYLGYWAKLAAGHRVEPLPLTEPHREVVIRFASTHRSPVPQPTGSIIRGLQASLTVPPNLRRAHPLVRATERELENARKDKRGRLRPPLRHSLVVNVSPALLRRALLAMDALVRCLEPFGVAPGPTVDLLGQRVRFGVRQHAEFRPIRASEVDLDEYNYQFGHNRTVTTLTDRLEFFTGHDCSETEKRRRFWIESSERTLEETLKEFLAGLVMHAARSGPGVSDAA